MSVSLPKETVKSFAKLRLINIIHEGKKKTAEDLATEILDVLEKELHFDVVEDNQITAQEL
jgi:hypothetical protein